MWTSSGTGRPASSGRAAHRPVIAVRNTLPIATDIIDDAA